MSSENTPEQIKYMEKYGVIERFWQAWAKGRFLVHCYPETPGQIFVPAPPFMTSNPEEKQEYFRVFPHFGPYKSNFGTFLWPP